MGKKATFLSLVLCVVSFPLADGSSFAARGPRTPAEQQRWIRQQQQQAQQQQWADEQRQKTAQQEAQAIWKEYSDEAWQEALGATAEQWQAIKPRLERVKRVEEPPAIRLSVYAFGGSSNSTSSSFSHGSGSAGGMATGGGFGGAGGSGGGGVSTQYSGRASGSATGGGSAGGIGQAPGLRATGGFYRGQSGSFASGGANHSSSYSFGIGGPAGPVKKKVGDVNLGWQWQRPSLDKSSGRLTEKQKTCERLLDVLETKSPDPEQVRQRLEALRQIREQIQAERQEARRQLRAVVTPEQEAKLVLMGYLD